MVTFQSIEHPQKTAYRRLTNHANHTYTPVHIPQHTTLWCIGYLTGVQWDLWDGYIARMGHAINSIAVTSWWARWRLKSPASRLFAQPFVQVQLEENIKAPRLWPLWGEFVSQMASNAENVSIWWRHRAFEDPAPVDGIYGPRLRWIAVIRFIEICIRIEATFKLFRYISNCDDLNYL